MCRLWPETALSFFWMFCSWQAQPATCPFLFLLPPPPPVHTAPPTRRRRPSWQRIIDLWLNICLLLYRWRILRYVPPPEFASITKKYP
ncbi:hypothetical protein B0H10DRAFT_1107885 [Mycena sp. CBHHK59/15]|nr:hypothetical protein B0H10DRAFT_1107885 [Mycena sp. CBHHK59/15]